MTKTVTLTRRSEIAYDTLPQEEQQKVAKMLEILKQFPNLPSGSYQKLKSQTTNLTPSFIARVGSHYRLIFTERNDNVEILDVINRDRLELFPNLVAG